MKEEKTCSHFKWHIVHQIPPAQATAAPTYQSRAHKPERNNALLNGEPTLVV